jgi:hypothetical protein
MPRIACLLAVMVLWLTGCPAQENLNQANYEQSLRIQAEVVGDELVVSTSSEKFAPDHYEVHRIFVVTSEEEKLITSGDGLLGAATIKLMAKMESFEHPQVLADGEVRVEYEVWQGEPEKGVLLFEGKKQVAIQP